MIQADQIKPDMPIVCSKNGALGVVDHMEGTETIKLKKDKKGQHHFIPLTWVKSLDAKVHLDRPGEQAMKEWSDSAPAKSAGKSSAASKANGASKNVGGDGNVDSNVDGSVDGNTEGGAYAFGKAPDGDSRKVRGLPGLASDQRASSPMKPQSKR